MDCGKKKWNAKGDLFSDVKQNNGHIFFKTAILAHRS